MTPVEKGRIIGSLSEEDEVSFGVHLLAHRARERVDILAMQLSRGYRE
jgi:hypothetical protein